MDTFIVEKNLIKNINKNEILDEEDYIAYFENIDLEKIATDISKSSSEINRLLRNLDSQRRPVLLSALMICLYPKEKGKDFKNSYSSWSPETIIINIPPTINAVLESEQIDKSKIEVLINELTFIKKDIDLNGTNILREILNELEKKFKEFDLSKLFTVRGSKKSYTKNEISFGEFLYITTSNKNNGVCSTSNIYTEKGNVITIDSATDGKAFYQENKFVGSDHVEVLEPINFKLNKYTALFFISLLNSQMFRYGYGRKRSQIRIKKEKLFLPLKDGNPNFEFMERYIKSLNYSSNL